MTARRWLKLDALNRAWRTILQGLVVTVAAAAGDAAIQVVQHAVVDAAAGRGFDWTQVGQTAGYTAGTAALMTLAAFVHRYKVDPSAVPSAQPPTP